MSTAIAFVRGDTYIEDWTLTALVTQTITIEGTPTGGTITLTRNGKTTAAIAYNGNAAAVQTALDGLSDVGAGDLTVSGGPGPGTAWVVTDNTLSPKALTVTSALTGGTNVSAYVTAGAFNLTGCTLRWTLKSNPTQADSSAAIRHSWIAGVGTGIVAASPANGIATHTITATESAALAVGTTYNWDLQLADASGIVKTLLDGTLTVNQDITVTAP